MMWNVSYTNKEMLIHHSAELPKFNTQFKLRLTFLLALPGTLTNLLRFKSKSLYGYTVSENDSHLSLLSSQMYRLYIFLVHKFNCTNAELLFTCPFFNPMHHNGFKNIDL